MTPPIPHLCFLLPSPQALSWALTLVLTGTAPLEPESVGQEEGTLSSVCLTLQMTACLPRGRTEDLEGPGRAMPAPQPNPSHVVSLISFFGGQQSIMGKVNGSRLVQ